MKPLVALAVLVGFCAIVAAQQPKRGPFQPRAEFRVEDIASKYPAAPAAKPGRFTTGQPADIVLGVEDDSDRNPEIGRDKLFQAATVAFDGARLWVGEFKFSTRVFRFTAK